MASRFGGLLLALLLIAPRAAMAQDATGDPPQSNDASVDPAQEAKQQYGAGAEAYAAKRFVEAALHFEAAASRRPHAAALYNAALAWEQANQPQRAADDFSRALDVAGLSAAQASNARSRIATLERTMGTLVVTAPDGFRVQLDANTEVPTPARLHAMPGTHNLTVLAPDKPIAHRDVTLELGKSTPIALTDADVAPKAEAPKPAPPPPPETKPVEEAPPPPPPWWTTRRVVGVGVAGVGVASLLGGVILGTNALGARDAYDAAPTQAGYDHASSLQTWTNVTLITGALLSVGGAALILWPDPKAKPTDTSVAIVPTLGGALVRGTF